MISKEEVLGLINKTSKYSHASVVSGIMCELAKKLGEDEEKWEILGLLHDLDYDQVTNDVRKHGVMASEILEGKLPEDCLYVIRSHDHRTGLKHKGKLDIGLIMADSLAVVIENGEETSHAESFNVNDVSVCAGYDACYLCDQTLFVLSSSCNHSKV